MHKCVKTTNLTVSPLIAETILKDETHLQLQGDYIQLVLKRCNNFLVSKLKQIQKLNGLNAYIVAFQKKLQNLAFFNGVMLSLSHPEQIQYFEEFSLYFRLGTGWVLWVLTCYYFLPPTENVSASHTLSGSMVCA